MKGMKVRTHLANHLPAIFLFFCEILTRTISSASFIIAKNSVPFPFAGILVANILPTFFRSIILCLNSALIY
ncbi:hypothetical protein HD806DRAFT_500340 [Xylariaceae sp. AK1471]|nr:hypothetical protein HD806DRAFT_500340 [Xylariaceae sp. AK1471]